MTATVITHGCRTNLAEAEGLAHWAGPGRTVINSCAVTAAAVRDARAAARRATRAGGEVWLTGCAAEVAPERFADLPVRRVSKPRLAAMATLRSRGFVNIQDGCDHGCTFCVTRLARGPARSAPVPAVVEAVADLVARGAAEVVLTGVDACAWGADLPGAPRLGTLVEVVLARVPGLQRLRLSTLDPAAVDERLVALFAEPRLMPHAHLSLQSGDDLVLKRMRRRHGFADAARLVARLKAVRPDIALGADVIAGFPTEGEAAHRASLAALDALDLVDAHVFPYSPRPGTAAARMPHVAPALARARAAELRAHVASRRARWLSGFTGTEIEIVAEGAIGLSPHFTQVRLAVPLPPGQLARVTVRGAEDGVLVQ